MPAVKVFNIFGQKNESKTSNVQSKGTMQRFYRAFSMGGDAPADQAKSTKVSTIAATLLNEKSNEGKVELKLNETTVQKFLTKINVTGAVPCVDEKDVTSIASYDDHIYANVDTSAYMHPIALSVNVNEENKGYASILEDANAVGVKTENEIDSLEVNADASDSKLYKALESFDKILSEFSVNSPGPDSVNNTFTPPILKKSKTCSIIESRCILKNTNFNSEAESKIAGSLKANPNALDKTTSLWNLDDMEVMQLNPAIQPLVPLQTTASEESSHFGRFDTYKVLPKIISQNHRKDGLKPDELKKLDVKNRILKKTLSNPPSLPVPVLGKSTSKKVERRSSDPKKLRQAKASVDKGKPVKLTESTIKSNKNNDRPEPVKPRLQKAKSVWELSDKGAPPRKTLERTKSSTSIVGSISKIPVVRSQLMTHNKFSSTRALFSPTPGDLSNLEQSKECVQKKKNDSVTKKFIDKYEVNKVIKSKSQLSIKGESRKQNEKQKDKETADSKNDTRSSARDYSNEINAVRAKLHQKRPSRKDLIIQNNNNRKSPVYADSYDPPLSPVKMIVRKLELKTAMETKSEIPPFLNCKIITTPRKDSCVANISLHNHLGILVGRQIKTIETKNDSRLCHNEQKCIPLLAEKTISDDKISDAHSDCSDDSGHVSNENEPVLESPEIVQDERLDKAPQPQRRNIKRAVNSAVKSNDITDEFGEKELILDTDNNAKRDNFMMPCFTEKSSKNVHPAMASNESGYTEWNKAVAPVKPVRRRAAAAESSAGRLKPEPSIEVSSGTAAAVGTKVDAQIFFRGGVVGALDARRDAALHERLTRLQARARGVLARRRAARLRVQHTAARCVQRNVRAFLAVRDWPWWRLLVRVMPLLAVHRTEERLRLAQDELETLRTKVEKIELERNHLKHDNEKLESKISAACGELAEERAAAASCAERADAETAERLRLERDLRDEQARNEKLQQASERLELEVLHARAAEASAAEDESGGGSGDDDAGYRRRYERAARELQLARAQLRRQHEDDLEQLVAVKKQLEKKVADAYEEVDEQRQVAAQWKRKVQKLTNDMADLRSLLDQQTCRNNLLEKRQRKFDAEAAGALEELRRERAAKERASRERDQALADKYATDQALNEVRLELELKDERLSGLEREADALRGGGGGGEGELAQLRRTRADLERKCRDQDEELDDLAGQIQLLESSKLRVEMLLEQQRKEARLEAQQRDDELEEARANALKKVKALEGQLETEHGERSLLLRERHELERRLGALEEHARARQHEDAQLLQRLKRDLKRHRALLRDAQTMLEQREKDSGSKAQIRQLKNQVEEAEVAVRAAGKARAALEAEASEATAALEEAQRARAEATERATTAARDATALRSQLDDAEEEAAELMKKYRTCATSLSGAQAGAREAEARAEAALEETRLLKERLAEATARLSAAEAGHEQDAQHHNKRMELRIKELESSLEMEQTARSRLEGQVARLRDAQDKAGTELIAAKQREQNAQDELRRLQRQMRDLREEQTALAARCEDAVRGRGAAEAAAAAAAAEAAAAREEARVAARRARALQEAIAGELSSPADSRDSDSDNDSYSSDESIETFLANHKLSPTTPSHSRPSLGDTQRSTDSRQSVSRSSVSSSKPHSPTKTSPVKESFA